MKNVIKIFAIVFMCANSLVALAQTDTKPSNVPDTPKEMWINDHRGEYVSMDGGKTWKVFKLHKKEAQINSYDLQTSPNPTSSRVTIQLNATAAESAIITFFDVQGTNVLQIEKDIVLGTNLLHIDVSKLQSGLYSYVVHTPSVQARSTITIIK